MIFESIAAFHLTNRHVFPQKERRGIDVGARRSLRSIIPVLGMMLASFISAACADDNACKSALDCGKNEVCKSGSCVPNESGTTDEHPSDEPPSDNDTASTPDSDSDLSTDTASNGPTDDSEGTDDTETNSDSAAETDSGTNGWQNGHACDQDSECRSSHCTHGFCCKEGICCGTPGDSSGCEQVQCTTVFCDGNFMCQYFDMACGAVDLVNATPCSRDSRCDGAGKCKAVTACVDDVYRGAGTFSCTETAIAEDCLTACTEAAHCAEGHRCVGDACVVKLGTGEHGCLENTDCTSGLCDPSTQVCCASGSCCDTDDDCGAYACDVAVGECLTTCRNDLSLDDDGACASSQDVHCDNGWCHDDLPDGAEWCDENSDCLSGYCDPESAICCEEGRCCIDGSDCDGMKCLAGSGNYCVESCAVGDVDDDALCDTGFYCEDGLCRAVVGKNGDSCDSNSQCESSHCENHVCCAEGECCASAVDCTAGLICNTASCTGNHQCVYYPLACGAADFNETETCYGDERCDGQGDCVALSPCDNGFARREVTCIENALTVVCETACEDDTDCDESYHCVPEECVPDIVSGNGQCDNNADCVSGNCNQITGICCDDGYCCDDDSQCIEFGLTCDDLTFSCLTMCEQDEDCAEFGDYHCEGNLCEPDIVNGETFCFEDTMCLSDYCDESTGICCDQGFCCVDDTDCDGFKCDDAYSCHTDCADNDDLCADGYFCDATVCKPKQQNGESCEQDADCTSDHCDLLINICCDGAGSCCNEAADCDDGDLCTNDFCSTEHSCYAVAKSDGESCSDGLFCNGPERCESGACVTGAVPCSDSSTCLRRECDEDNNRCNDIPQNEGDVCSETEFCLGGVARVCNATGLCVDPGTGTPPCTGDTGNPCTVQACDETQNTCIETSMPDGAACDDNPCNGDRECHDGVCAAATTLPCEDGDPCTTDECTEVDGAPVCGGHVAKGDGEACDPTPCIGEGATCWQGTCLDSNSICGDGRLCTVNSCYMMVSGQTCSEDTGYAVDLTCGETATVTDEDFLTLEASSYGAGCPGTFNGPEASMRLVLNADSNVTVSVSDADPAMSIEILSLADWCDASTCVSNGTDILGVSLTAGEHIFVLEAPLGPPPNSVDVSVVCP